VQKRTADRHMVRRWRLGGLQVFGRGPAGSSVGEHLEFHLLSFVERHPPGALNRSDVHDTSLPPSSGSMKPYLSWLLKPIHGSFAHVLVGPRTGRSPIRSIPRKIRSTHDAAWCRRRGTVLANAQSTIPGRRQPCPFAPRFLAQHSRTRLDLHRPAQIYP